MKTIRVEGNGKNMKNIWTKKLPTGPGYYWTRALGYDEVVPQVFLIEQMDDGRLWICGDIQMPLLSAGASSKNREEREWSALPILLPDEEE